MQEEIENRTVALSITAAKFTGNVLNTAISKYMQHQISKKSHDSSIKPQGKQSVKELIGQNQGVTNIEIDKDIGQFDRIARKYGVDYAVKKVHDEGKTKYLVFFKGRDTDAITSAFKEYTQKTVKVRESVFPKLHRTLEKPIKPKIKNKELGL